LIGLADFLLFHLADPVSRPFDEGWDAADAFPGCHFVHQFSDRDSRSSGRYYYRFNILYKSSRPVIHTVKYGLVLYALVVYALQRVTFDRSKLPDDLLDYINQTIESSTGLFSGWDKGLGMLLGIIAGGLRIALTFIFGLLALTVLPALMIFAARMIQQLIDWLVHRFIYRNRITIHRSGGCQTFAT
jgi:hypothetical protein